MLMERKRWSGSFIPGVRKEKNEDKRQPDNCEAADSLIFNILRVQPLSHFAADGKLLILSRSLFLPPFSPLLSAAEECKRHNVLLRTKHRRVADWKIARTGDEFLSYQLHSNMVLPAKYAAHQLFPLMHILHHVAVRFTASKVHKTEKKTL